MVDLMIVAIILFFIIYGVHRGFMITVFNLASFILSIIIMYLIYPHVSAALYKAGLYETVRGNAAKHLGAGIESLLQIPLAETEDSVLRTLNMPDFFKESLINSNRPEIHSYLDAMNISEFVSGFIANAVVNIAAMLLVFLIVFVIMKVIAASLRLISMLPAVNILNKIGGGAIGAVQGVFIVWLLLSASLLLLGTSKQSEISMLLQESKLAHFFQTNNFIYQTVTKIIT